MNEPQQSRLSDQRSFRVLAVAAVTAAVVQVALGGVVRATGSGLGCPDWPLCHGGIIPPLDSASLIEYSHRVSASVLGLVVVALAILAFVRYRSDRWTVTPAVVAVALVLVAAALGGLTVWSELDWWFRLLHLAVAELIVACLAVVSVAGWNARGLGTRVGISVDRTGILSLGSAMGLYVLILYGSYMVGLGYGASCATWPLCQGSVLPSGAPYMVHMLHRLMAVVVGVIIVTTSVSVCRKNEKRLSVRWTAGLLVAMFVAQMFVGATTVWATFTPLMKSIHLSLATLVWLVSSVLGGLLVVPRMLDSGNAVYVATDGRAR